MAKGMTALESSRQSLRASALAEPNTPIASADQSPHDSNAAAKEESMSSFQRIEI